jgi:hypothetical protein
MEGGNAIVDFVALKSSPRHGRATLPVVSRRLG